MINIESFKLFLCRFLIVILLTIGWIVMLPVMLPFIIIIKTVVTIWQPCFYKSSLNYYEERRKEWNHIASEYCKKGIHIDYPPTKPKYGSFLGIGPWYKKSFMCLLEEDEY